MIVELIVNQAHAIKTIASLNDRPLVLFLGAGASASAGIPLGNRYRDLALGGLVGWHEDGQAAAEAFFDLLYERQHFLLGEAESRTVFASELTLERVLLTIINPRFDFSFVTRHGRAGWEHHSAIVAAELFRLWVEFGIKPVCPRDGSTQVVCD